MFRSVVGAGMLVVSLVVSGCTFTPVYSNNNLASTTSLEFNYGDPNSRIDQIVYQELSLRFPTSKAADATKLTVTTASRGGNPFLSRNPGRQELRDVSVTATAVLVSQNGEELFRVSRKATAEYTRVSQVLADRAAAVEAEERAAKAAAESLRLALLSNFARGLPVQ